MESLHISLADMPKGRFAAHGDFRIWVDGDVLRYEVQGPVNIELIRAMVKARQHLVAAWQPKQPVGTIVHWFGSALMTADAFAMWESAHAEATKSNSLKVAEAWVASPMVEGMGLLLKTYEARIQNHGSNFRFFENYARAHEWVRQEIQKNKHQGPPSAVLR